MEHVQSDNWELLLKEFDNKTATLIQIGANDGKLYGDEILFNLASKNNLWKKILIEPIKENMELLKLNYSKSNNVFFEQIAIGEENTNRVIYANIDSSDSLFGALSTFKKEITENIFRKIKYTEVEVIMKKFSYIIDKYNIKDIDILQIDTEGYDAFILKEILNYNLYPKILKAESGFMTFEEKEHIIQILQMENYMYIEDFPDLIFKKL